VDELPPATQTGSNTFGAKVNGTFWAPQGFGVFSANNILDARRVGNAVVINARNFASSPNETEFEFILYDVLTPGVYLLNTDVSYPNGTSNYAYYVKRNFTPQDEWITSSTHTGSVNITKMDTVNKVVSGNFQFDAKSLYSSDVLHVTEGRFDIKYH
jgi:hypothetical protein